MKKSLAIAALALATTFTTSLTAAQAETLNVGMSGGYFPFTFVKLDKLQGFEVDFINAVAEKTGHEVEFVTMSFSGLIGALESGRIDTVANQIKEADITGGVAQLLQKQRLLSGSAGQLA